MRHGTHRSSLGRKPGRSALDVITPGRRRATGSRMEGVHRGSGPRGVIVLALVLGASVATGPAAGAASPPGTKYVHVTCTEAGGGWVVSAPGIPPGPPAPWTLGGCDHGLAGGDLSSDFSVNTGTSSIAWANGATSTISYWVDSVPGRETSHKCPADQFGVVYGAFRLHGQVTGGTPGGNGTGVSGRLRAWICYVRTPGSVASIGYTLAPGTTFSL